MKIPLPVLLAYLVYISFDRVKTAPFADMGSSDRPLTETEKKFFQAGTDSIYLTFKTRVSKGRKKELAAVDSIAQGRVWTGKRAIGAGLVDRIGTLQDAVNCAAKMSKLTDYTLKEYPEKKNILDQLMSTYKKSIKKDLIEEELGKEPLLLLKQMKQMKEMVGVPQTRLPFMVVINN